MADGAPGVPSGYAIWPISIGFIGHNGPLYLRHDEQGPALGCRIEPIHCNPLGIAHGGWMATVMDMLLPTAARFSGEADLENRFFLTINMTLDFLGSPKVGDWVVGRGQLLKRTKRMVFVQGWLSVGDEIMLRGSGVYKIGAAADPEKLGMAPRPAEGG